MGGKSRIASKLAPIVNAVRSDATLLWEPFCGGLAMTKALGGVMLASDLHPGLIELYRVVQSQPDILDGIPLSEEIFRAAQSWPDDDPLKAFYKFGCSFGGDWNGGYARPDPRTDRGYEVAAAESLKKACRKEVQFECCSFFDIEPEPGLLLYCDPPYRGTTGYFCEFDHAAFYGRCEAWARKGCPVFISEYDCPIGSCVWEKPGVTQLVSKSRKAHVERLYRL
jgi:DNA adenine methylase